MKPKKALIISFSGIGDAILTEVLCENLKQMFPKIIVDMVVKDNSFPLFLNNPAIDNVIPYYNNERKNYLKYVKKTWNVMKKKYDIILDVESTPRSELFSLFGKKAAYRAGWYKVSKHKILWMKVKRGFFYNNKIVRDNKESVTKNLTKFLDPLIKISSLENYEKTFDFRLCITDEEKQKMRKVMEEAGINFSKPVIMCAVNSVSDGKRWRKDYMMEVLKYILNNYDSMSEVIIGELDNFKKEYGRKRRTVVENAEEAVFEEKKIEEQEVVFLMDRFGYKQNKSVSILKTILWFHIQ